MRDSLGSRRAPTGPPEPASSGFRPSGIAIATAWVVLAVALLVSVSGSVFTYVTVSGAFKRQTAVDHARLLLTELYELQLEEETGLRGYLATGQKVFIQPYEVKKAQFDPIFKELEGYVLQARLEDAAVPLHDLQHEHSVWHAQVGDPLVAQPNAPDALLRLQQGKLILDQI